MGRIAASRLVGGVDTEHKRASDVGVDGAAFTPRLPYVARQRSQPLLVPTGARRVNAGADPDVQAAHPSLQSPRDATVIGRIVAAWSLS